VHGLSTARHRRAPNRVWFSAPSEGPGAGGKRSPVSGKLALKVGLCLCAGQLIAGPVLASAAEAAPVLTAATQTASKITESVSTTRLQQGSAVKITAKVINPKTGKVATKGYVRIQVQNGKSWRKAGQLNLGRSGVVTFVSKPKGTTTFRTVFSGGAGGLSSSTSNRIQVKVVSSAGTRVLAEAKKHTGALYKFAAAGPSRFDCSGYTMYVYRKAIGKKLPHQANLQQRYGKAVGRSQKKVGDLIVFRSGSYGYHAAIYAGGNYMYDSPHTGARVGKHKIYGSNYVVRRLAA
jgi:peptidoglycan DL-endopeptidase CwlO